MEDDEKMTIRYNFNLLFEKLFKVLFYFKASKKEFYGNKE